MLQQFPPPFRTKPITCWYLPTVKDTHNQMSSWPTQQLKWCWPPQKKRQFRQNIENSLPGYCCATLHGFNNDSGHLQKEMHLLSSRNCVLIINCDSISECKWPDIFRLDTLLLWFKTRSAFCYDFDTRAYFCYERDADFRFLSSCFCSRSDTTYVFSFCM